MHATSPAHLIFIDMINLKIFVKNTNHESSCKTWGSHTTDYEYACFLGCYTMLTGKKLPKFKNSKMPSKCWWLFISWHSIISRKTWIFINSLIINFFFQSPVPSSFSTLFYNILSLLRVIFWVVPRCVMFNSRCFGTLCLFHLHRRVDMKCVNMICVCVEAGTDWPRLVGGLQVAVGGC
jgi:hypothetical protein